MHLPRKSLFPDASSADMLPDSIDKNIEEYRKITKTLYGGDQEMRICQEIVLGMAGIELLSTLGLNPTVYHMNEGHSAFLTLKLIENIIKEKKVSFEIAESPCSSMLSNTSKIETRNNATHLK